MIKIIVGSAHRPGSGKRMSNIHTFAHQPLEVRSADKGIAESMDRIEPLMLRADPEGVGRLIHLFKFQQLCRDELRLAAINQKANRAGFFTVPDLVNQERVVEINLDAVIESDDSQLEFILQSA